MIFDEETRKHWPPTKKDYKVGDRVKVIDLGDETADRTYLGLVGTVEYLETDAIDGIGESQDDPYFLVRFDSGDRDAFWAEELRPAVPGELSVPIPAGADLTKLTTKALLIGVMKAGKSNP